MRGQNAPGACCDAAARMAAIAPAAGMATLSTTLSSDPVIALPSLPETTVAVAALNILPPPIQTLPANPAWKRYAVHAHYTHDQPLVAIVIDDMGVDLRRSARVLELDAALTLSYLPYAAQLTQQTARAAGKGFELMLHMPMEPQRAVGGMAPEQLTVSMSQDDIRRQLDKDLGSMTGFVGINNHMGSKFTTDTARMGVVMDAVSDRGLLFLDSKSSPRSVGERLARARGLPALSRDVFLDDDPSPAGVAAALKDVERIARRKGMAIAIGHPKDATIAALRTWIPEARKRGIAIVPISAIAKLREGQDKQADDAYAAADAGHVSAATTTVTTHYPAQVTLTHFSHIKE